MIRGQHGICVALDPLAAQTVLGVSLSDLTNRVVALDDVLPRRFRSVAAELHDQPGWPGDWASFADWYCTDWKMRRT
jgi:hypothetical protein